MKNFKTHFTLTLFVSMLCLISCGEKKPTEAALTVESNLGRMSGLASFDTQLTLQPKTNAEGVYIVSIPLNINSTVGTNRSSINFTVEMFDNNHSSLGLIDKISYRCEPDYDSNCNFRISGIARAELEMKMNPEMWNKICTEGAILRLSIDAPSYQKFTNFATNSDYLGGNSEGYDDGYYDESNSNEASYDDYEEPSSSKSSGSTNWDELLDAYEKYVDSYIAMLKKAMKGDASAMSEYPTLLEKAQEFANKCSAGKNEMTPAQAARLGKISLKMVEEAQKLQ